MLSQNLDSMINFNIETFDNHLILLSNDNRFLIDTGSPTTIAKSTEIDIFNSKYKVSQKYLGLEIDKLSELVGTDLDGLIGGNILKNHVFHIDFKNKSFSILDSIPDNIDFVDIDFYMNIPIININLDNQSVRAFLDTGAKISYLNSEYVQDSNSIGDKEDFYPSVGVFKTSIYNKSIMFPHDKQLNLTFGSLPESLEQALSFGGTKAIIGNDIFSYYSLIFDYSNKRIYFV